MAAAAAALGTALVQAAGTDTWTWLRQRSARLVGRGDAARERDALDRLDRTAAVLDAADEAELERVRTEQAALWQGLLESLLESLEPAERERLAAGLRALEQEFAQRRAPADGALTGNTFHGPTAFQVGDHNQQDVRFGPAG